MESLIYLRWMADERKDIGDTHYILVHAHSTGHTAEVEARIKVKNKLR